MNFVLVSVTFASMDAGVELTGMYLQRVTESGTKFMSTLMFESSNTLGAMLLGKVVTKLMGQQ